MVDAVKKGPELPGAEPVRPAGRKERRKKKQEQAQRGLDKKQMAGGEKETTDEHGFSRMEKDNLQGKRGQPWVLGEIEPVDVKIELAGQMKIGAMGCLDFENPHILIRPNLTDGKGNQRKEKVFIRAMDAGLEVNFRTDNEMRAMMANVVGLMKACQTKEKHAVKRGRPRKNK